MSTQPKPPTSDVPPRDAFVWPRLRVPRITMPRVSVSRVTLPGARGFIATVMIARSSRLARRNGADVAYGGLALASLMAIVFVVGLHVSEWRRTPEAIDPPPPTIHRAVPIAATTTATAMTATAMTATQEPVAQLTPAAQTTTPRTRLASSSRPSYSRRAARTTAGVVSPPLRLPESYVRPRVVSSRGGARMRGTVVLGVVVRSNGRVGDVNVVSGDVDGDLERAAIAAVKQWRYRPALRDGVPTPARVKVVVTFD